MKTVWTCTTYVSSALPLTEKVKDVMSFTFLVVSEEKPSEELIMALVNSHTRNCEPLMTEVTRAKFPQELL